MVLGTSSGAGKSLTVAAICRILKNLGGAIPFKGQNMSNNAWVDCKGRDGIFTNSSSLLVMFLHQVILLLKPQGDSIAKLFILGKV